MFFQKKCFSPQNPFFHHIIQKTKAFFLTKTLFLSVLLYKNTFRVKWTQKTKSFLQNRFLYNTGLSYSEKYFRIILDKRKILPNKHALFPASFFVFLIMWKSFLFSFCSPFLYLFFFFFEKSIIVSL